MKHKKSDALSIGLFVFLILLAESDAVQTAQPYSHKGSSPFEGFLASEKVAKTVPFENS
jgi:hypothetical protein